jgi:hypothetical protein
VFQRPVAWSDGAAADYNVFSWLEQAYLALLLTRLETGF